MQIRKKLGILVGAFIFMMRSSKEQWRQQISDYDNLFIKGG